jgi:hypothetical protein
MENAGISLLLSGMALLTAIGLYARRLPRRRVWRERADNVPLGVIARSVLLLPASDLGLWAGLRIFQPIGLLAVPGLLLQDWGSLAGR